MEQLYRFFFLWDWYCLSVLCFFTACKYPKWALNRVQKKIMIHKQSRNKNRGLRGNLTIEEFNLVAELSMGKIEVDQGMNKITGMIIGEEILEVM